MLSALLALLSSCCIHVNMVSVTPAVQPSWSYSTLSEDEEEEEEGADDEPGLGRDC